MLYLYHMYVYYIISLHYNLQIIMLTCRFHSDAILLLVIFITFVPLIIRNIL